MAGLRVFISSTCYDLSLLRSQLRIFINSMGYDPVMSDYEDVLYDPRIHTHTSCVDEVTNCDMVILVIGSRFGGKATVESLSRIDFDKIENVSLKVDELKEEEPLSVTQIEVLKAIENAIPVYTFIDRRVWYDHALYEKNKSKDIIDEIVFPSIEKQDTAKYVFKFINFVRSRTKGNSIFTFEKTQDIEEILKKQWASYFQRLLYEQRFAETERKQIDHLSDRFEDLKTAILSSIPIDQREIARGIVQFRSLFDFLCSLRTLQPSYLTDTNDSWENLLQNAGIQETMDIDIGKSMTGFSNRVQRFRTVFIKTDRTYYESRLGVEQLTELARDWNAFTKLKNESRKIIVETLSDMPQNSGLIRLRKRSIDEVLDNLQYTDGVLNFLDITNER